MATQHPSVPGLVVQNNAFVTAKGARCSFEEAIAIGKAWVEADPNKRCLYAFKEDVEREERAALLEEAHARG